MATIRIAVRHASVPEDLQAFAEEKCDRLDKFLRGDPRLEFVFEQNHAAWRGEVILHGSRHHERLVAHDEHADLHGCVEKLIDKLEHQLGKSKERRKDHHHGPSFSDAPRRRRTRSRALQKRVVARAAAADPGRATGPPRAPPADPVLMPLVRRSVTLINPKGLHARPISKIVEVARGHQATLFIRYGAVRVNGRRMLEMLGLVAPLGAVLELEAEGDDAEALVTALERLVASQFGD